MQPRGSSTPGTVNITRPWKRADGGNVGSRMYEALLFGTQRGIDARAKKTSTLKYYQLARTPALMSTLFGNDVVG